jgi:hypothetical protein
MTARAFRVGVLLRDHLVEERVIRAGVPISIGQSLRCTLSIPSDGLPREHVLVDAGGVLRITAQMVGRLAVGDTIQTLDELRTRPAADGIWAVPLARSARGKLALGEVTILFQELVAPPVQPRPQLPASVRGSLADRIDRRLAVIVGSSILLHVGIAAWAWATDFDDAPLGVPDVAREYHQDAIEVSMPDTSLVPPTDTGAAVPALPPLPVPSAVRPAPRPAPAPAPTRPSLHEDDVTRMISALTDDHEGPNGPGGMRARVPGADLHHQIDEVRDGNQHVALGNPTGGFRHDPDPRRGTSTGPVVDPPPDVTHSPTHRIEDDISRIPLVPIPQPVPPDERTTLTPEMVLDKINHAYMPGLKRCYAAGLRGDDALAGKLAVTFTVNETGRVVEVEADGIGHGVDTCVRNFMGTWHFPAPKKNGAPSEARFGISLVLR